MDRALRAINLHSVGAGSLVSKMVSGLLKASTEKGPEGRRELKDISKCISNNSLIDRLMPLVSTELETTFGP